MSSSNPSSNEVSANNLLVSSGYALLLIGVVNVLHIVLTSKFRQDSVWEITTLGRLVDVSPMLIIGISFIFYGESRWTNLRSSKESIRFFILKNLSWMTLMLSVGYLSMLLVAANASKKIIEVPPPITSLSFSQTTSQPILASLNNGSDVSLLKSSDLVPLRSPNIRLDESNVIDVRNQLVSDDQVAQNDTQDNLRLDKIKQHQYLFEKMGKWYVEATVYTLVLFHIWYLTKWARNPAKSRRKRSSSSSASTINVDNESQSKDD